MPAKPTYEELEKKVHKLKQALLTSKQDVTRFRQVMDYGRPVIYAKDINGQYTLVNKAFEELSGFSRAEVIGKTDFELFPADVAENSTNNDRKVIETSNPIKIEEFGPVQGEIHNFMSFKYPLISYDGKIDGVCGISTDITEQKSAEKNLREKEKEIRVKQKKLEKSEALFRGLFDNMTSGSAIYEVINGGLKGADYIIKGFNKTSLEIEGKTIDQVIGKSLFDLRPNIDAFGLVPILKRVWETGEPDYFPTKIYQDENFLNYYENFIFKLPSGEVVTIYNDVTDQKNFELALKSSEEKYKDLFMNMAQGAFYQSKDGKLFGVNSAALEMFGLTYDQFIGRTSKDPQWQVIHEDGTDFPGEEHPSMVSLRTGKECRDVVAGIYNTKKGSYIWASINAIPQFKEGEEQPYQVFVTMHDITDRKQSEDLLRIQHDLAIKLSHTVGFDEGLEVSLDAALNASKMDGGALYLFDKETQELNIKFHKGLSDDFISNTCNYKKNSPNVNLIMKGQPLYANHKNLDLNLTESEKKENLKALSIVPIKFQEQIFGCLNVASKSTETIPESTRIVLETITNQIGQSFLHLKTQTDLQKSEEKYRNLIETMPNGFYLSTPEGYFLEANPAFISMLGYDSLSELKKVYIPHDIYVNEIERATAQKNTEFINKLESYRLKRKDGKIIWIEDNARYVKNKEGVVLYNQGICRDVTDRKQAEGINKVLFAISNAVNIAGNLDELYKQIHNLVGKIIDATNFFIALVNEDKHTLFFPYYQDTVDDDFATVLNFDPKDSLTGLVVSKRKPLLLKRGQLRELADKDGVWGPVPLIWMGVPLVVRSKIIGVIVVQSYTDPHLYNEKDLNVLVSISDQMAIAIDRKRTENELIKSEKKYRSMMESLTDHVYICSPEKKIEYMNSVMINRLGRDATGESCYNAIHGLSDKCEWCVYDKNKFDTAVENTITSPLDNRTYRITNVPIYNDDNSISNMAIYKDITDYLEAVDEKEKAQAQLAQAQKMESIGNLAGGIAHDFNNILSSIIGFTELAIDDVERGSVIEDNLQEVHIAGKRARDLVAQILAFARQSDEKIQPIQVDKILKEVLQFIRSSIPTNIEIKKIIGSDSPILGNQTQVYQVMMNICTNAAHAMEENGGVLEVRLKDTEVDRFLGKKLDLKQDNYIKISIADTGVGIPPEIIDSIFEPYFTTKGPGEGTGMGLAMVHGIVESYGGKIYVKSSLGKGTTFTIYLPIARKRKITSQYEPEELPTGTERILFVDDEAPIAKMGARTLEGLGYIVKTSTSSLDALNLFRAKPNEFDLVISDMTMPNMTGEVLASKVMSIHPNIPVILCTGYSKKISEDSAAEIGIKAFAYKPIVKADLAKTVRKVLDEAKG